MDEAERLLAEVEQIIDTEAAQEEAITKLMELFGFGRRQAEMTLHRIRANTVSSARKYGMPVQEYVDKLNPEKKLALYGFSAGVVAQQDFADGLDPETGERKPGPDYDI